MACRYFVANAVTDKCQGGVSSTCAPRQEGLWHHRILAQERPTTVGDVRVTGHYEHLEVRRRTMLLPRDYQIPRHYEFWQAVQITNEWLSNYSAITTSTFSRLGSVESD